MVNDHSTEKMQSSSWLRRCCFHRHHFLIDTCCLFLIALSLPRYTNAFQTVLNHHHHCHKQHHHYPQAHYFGKSNTRRINNNYNPSVSLFSESKNSNKNADTKSSLSAPSVLCIGETLWDSLPDGMYLGGAPTNVAVHLAELFTANHNHDTNNKHSVAIATCIGNDRLGTETLRRLSNRRVCTDLVQRCQTYDTGLVVATIDSITKDATYTFDTPSAWDCLSLTHELEDAVRGCDVMVLGTIAARLEDEDGIASRTTIQTIRNMIGSNNIVLDVNLRSPWYDPEFVLQLALGDDNNDDNELAFIKVNDEELSIMEEWCDLPHYDHCLQGDPLQKRMEALGNAVRAKRVCVTRGENGAALYCRDDQVFVENDGYSIGSNNNDGDTVGAGDAFLASLIKSLFLDRESPDLALKRGCALGGYVAGCRGAMPSHDNAPLECKAIVS